MSWGKKSLYISFYSVLWLGSGRGCYPEVLFSHRLCFVLIFLENCLFCFYFKVSLQIEVFPIINRRLNCARNIGYIQICAICKFIKVNDLKIWKCKCIYRASFWGKWEAEGRGDKANSRCFIQRQWGIFIIDFELKIECIYQPGFFYSYASLPYCTILNLKKILV